MLSNTEHFLLDYYDLVLVRSAILPSITLDMSLHPDSKLSDGESK